MLRASLQYAGSDAQLDGISAGSKLGNGGIEHGECLTAFAEAALQDDPAALKAARDRLRKAAGSQSVVDAAAVIGNFERMVRIADGTGIPLDGFVELLSDDFRAELGLDEFQSRRTIERGLLSRSCAPLFRRVVRAGLRIAGRFSAVTKAGLALLTKKQSRHPSDEETRT